MFFYDRAEYIIDLLGYAVTKVNDLRRPSPAFTGSFGRTGRTQSVQRTGGILRDLQAFFWLRVFPAPKQNLSPPKIR